MASYCRDCGVQRTSANSVGRGWHCTACSDEHFILLDMKRRLCASIDRDHSVDTCIDCLTIKTARKRVAAKRGAETRRNNHPRWMRPMTADLFWATHAHTTVAHAIRHGVLPKLDGTIACADCGGVATEYDHRDYSRPLDVDPCCKPCNRRRGTAKWPSAADYDFPRIPQAHAA